MEKLPGLLPKQGKRNKDDQSDVGKKGDKKANKKDDKADEEADKDEADKKKKR